MGLVIDTQAFSAKKPTVAGAVAVVFTGTTLVVRNFASPATAKLLNVFRQDAESVAGFVQIKSPRLVNNVTGIKLACDDSPAAKLLSVPVQQTMYASDTLTVNVSGTTTATTYTTGAIQLYYSTLGGGNQRLHNWADVNGNLADLFTQTVAIDVASAVAWKTVLSNATADLMEADRTYALLGYTVDAPLCAVGLRASELSTYRVCGPGVTRSEVTSSYFVDLASKTGLACIPVVNSNNRGNIRVTACASAATSTNVTLQWAMLTSAVSP